MPPSRDWASSGRLKLERAYHHIFDLEDEIIAFRERRPYEIVTKYEVNGIPLNGTSFHVHVNEQMPPEWSTITADAIHNLHVAMDHMWQRAVHGAKSVRRDPFPAYPSPDAAKSRFGGKEQGAIKTAVEILRSVDAFEVGNPFWAIREFDDTDKHDTLSFVAISIKQITSYFNAGVPDANFPSPWGVEFKKAGLGVLEEGVQLLFVSGPPIAQADVNHHLPFEIAFGVGAVFEGESVFPTLHHFAQVVEALSAAFIEAGLIT